MRGYGNHGKELDQMRGLASQINPMVVPLERLNDLYIARHHKIMVANESKRNYRIYIESRRYILYYLSPSVNQYFAYA